MVFETKVPTIRPNKGLCLNLFTYVFTEKVFSRHIIIIIIGNNNNIFVIAR
jgi:hypothetical protein